MKHRAQPVRLLTAGRHDEEYRERPLDFRLIAPVTVSYFPEKNKSRQ